MPAHVKVNRNAHDDDDDDDQSDEPIDLDDHHSHSDQDEDDDDDDDDDDEDDYSEDDHVHSHDEEDFEEERSWELIDPRPDDRSILDPSDSASRSRHPSAAPRRTSRLPTKPPARRTQSSRAYKVPEPPPGPAPRRGGGKRPSRPRSEIDTTLDEDDYIYGRGMPPPGFHPGPGWAGMPMYNGGSARTVLSNHDPFEPYSDPAQNPFTLPPENGYYGRQRGNRMSMPPRAASGHELMTVGPYGQGYPPYGMPYPYGFPGYPPFPHHPGQPSIQPTPSPHASKKGTPAPPGDEPKPKTPVPDPAFKLIQDMLIDQKKREEERAKAELAKIADAKASAAAAKLKAEEDKLAKLQELIIQHNKDQMEREKRQETQRQKEAAEKAAAELKAVEEKKRADDKAKEVKAAAEMAKLEAEKEAAKKAAEEKEKHEKEIEEAKKKAADLEAAKKKFEEEAKSLRPKDDMLKPPIKFKDAVGRKFSFPWHVCKTWKGMEALIHQAFMHVDVIGQHVHEGHYDLIGSDGEIILPQVWETMVKPDMSITMHMWPIAEPKKAPPAHPMGMGMGGDINAILGPMPGVIKGGKKKKKVQGGPFPPPPPGAMAFMGGGPIPPPPGPLPPGIAPVIGPGIAEILGGGKKKGSSSKEAGKKKSSSSSKGLLNWVAGGNPSRSSSKSKKKHGG